MQGRALGAIVVLLILPTLAGCSGGSITNDLASSVAQSLSAAQTSRIALVQQHEGRDPDGVTSTAFEDMLREAQDAESSAASASPPGSAQRAERDRVLALLHRSTLAVVASQDTAEQVSGAASPALALRNLDRVIAALEAARARLGSGR
jgi:hypothetical protein